MAKYRLKLSAEERAELEGMLRKGKGAARVLTRARILLKADCGPDGPNWDDATIAEALEVGESTVHRTRQRAVEEGVEAALQARPTRRIYTRKIDGELEAHLIALACGDPPSGRSRWTLQLLADQAVTFGWVDALSRETVRQMLKKTNSSRG
jgi:transposase